MTANFIKLPKILFLLTDVLMCLWQSELIKYDVHVHAYINVLTHKSQFSPKMSRDIYELFIAVAQQGHTLKDADRGAAKSE